MNVGILAAAMFVLPLEPERSAGRVAVRQPNVLAFEIEEPFLVPAGIGAPLFALIVLSQCCRLLAGRSAG